MYILSSKRNGTLYIGVTSDIIKRVWEHKNSVVEGFSKKYGVYMLVYFEMHDTMESAITREKQMKKWKREWKIKLIEDKNPNWDDLYDRLLWWWLKRYGFPPTREWRDRTRKSPSPVIPANAGIQVDYPVNMGAFLDSRLRGYDGRRVWRNLGLICLNQ